MAIGYFQFDPQEFSVAVVLKMAGFEEKVLFTE